MTDSKLRAAAQAVIDAVDEEHDNWDSTDAAIKALREALAAPEEPYIPSISSGRIEFAPEGPCQECENIRALWETQCRSSATYQSRLRGIEAEAERLDKIATDAFAMNDQLRAEVERLATLLRRYRNETPLGHQPHMIAAEVDAALEGKP